MPRSQRESGSLKPSDTGDDAQVSAQGSDSEAPSKRGDGGPSRRPEAGLHIVATPIGNLGDITQRAIQVLAGVDLIACEDTRVSRTLLRHHGIGTPSVPYHEHNAEKMRPELMARLAAGGRVALISDAGTPLVSDPGYKLARAAIEAGHRVHAVPGASAVLAALVLSGLPSDRFLFAGFLDSKTVARRKDLAGLAAVPATLVFFEGPSRLAASLADMASVLGDRPAAVIREITKLYEESRRGSLAELAAHYAEAGPPKGEIVVVVGPPLEALPPDAETLDERLRVALAASSLRDAASAVATELGLPRRQVYARAVELADEARDDE